MAPLARVRSDSLVQGITSWAVVLMVLAPIAVLLSRSFYIERFGEPIIFTLHNFSVVFTDDVIRYAIGNTLIASLGSTAFAAVAGITLAWLNTRTNTPARPFLHICNTIPFYLSPFVGAIAWTYLAAPRTGLLNSFVFHHLGVAGRFLQRLRHSRHHLGAGNLLHPDRLSDDIGGLCADGSGSSRRARAHAATARPIRCFASLCRWRCRRSSRPSS